MTDTPLPTTPTDVQEKVSVPEKQLGVTPYTVPAQPAPQQAAASNLNYFVTVIIMVLGVLMAVVLVSVFYKGEGLVPVIASIFGFGVTITTSILAFQQSQATHVAVNSRLDQFIRTAQTASLAEGLARGQVQGQAQANARTDAIKANEVPPTPKI